MPQFTLERLNFQLTLTLFRTTYNVTRLDLFYLASQPGLTLDLQAEQFIGCASEQATQT